MVHNKFGEHYQVHFQNEDDMQVLKSIRDYIHVGHMLLTHPLAGSVKPNETPYKSVLITTAQTQLDFRSVKIIEESIYTCEKFVSTTENRCQEILTDFQYIDCSLIENAIASAVARQEKL